MGNLIKISISVLNFSFNTGKPTTYDLLFLVTRYFPKNDNKHPPEMRNFGPILTTGLKCLLTFVDLQLTKCCQISPKFFSIQSVPQKIQVSQAQSSWFVF